MTHVSNISTSKMLASDRSRRPNVSLPTDSAVNESTDNDEQVAAPDGFHVVDEGSANWVIRKILEARCYAIHVQEWAEAEKRRAQRDEEQLLFRFSNELEQWLRDELRARGGRSKFVALPAGRLSLRQSTGRLVVMDEAKALEWAEHHLPTAIMMTVVTNGSGALALKDWCSRQSASMQATCHLLKSFLAEHLSSTGELPEGVQWEAPRNVLNIR